MMMFFQKYDPIPAVAFLENFCRPPWTLAAWRSNGGRWIETKQCNTKQEAFSFISKHRAHMLRFLLGYSRLPVTKVPEPGDLLMSCGVAACIPLSKVRDLPVPPAVLIEGPGYGIAAWRYIVHTHAGVAGRKITDFAARFAQTQYCPVKPLTLMMPLPGQHGFDLVFQRKNEVIDTLSLDDHQPRRARPAKHEDEDESFVRGDQARADRGLPVIKKGWVPGDAITLFIGREKYGKSMGIAKLSSYITSGGSMEPVVPERRSPDGLLVCEWHAGWWDGQPVLPEARGSVIVCEEEDPQLETLARLRAAGCDMSKVHVRVMVPDISNQSQLRKVTKLSEELGDNRMISFSPLLSAIPSRDYNEGVVRDKIRPIQKWMRGRRITIVGVIHTDPSGKKATTGSAVIPRVCRSGISFEDHPDDKGAEDPRRVMRVSLSNAGKMGVMIPYRIEGTMVQVDGVWLDTARMVFK